MNDLLTLQKELEKQKKLVNLLVIAFNSMLLVLASLFFLSFKDKDSKEVLRVKGIVIVDDQGRERILIGAATPDAKNRIRTDTTKVRELWGKKYKNPSAFMKKYRQFKHQADGIIFLDENGFDRLAIGSDLPDAQNAPRVGKMAGMVFFDDKGAERGGAGILKVEGGNRVAFTLDDANGQDAVSIAVREDGQSGMLSLGQHRAVFVGSAPAGSITPEPFAGMLVADDKGNMPYKLNKAAAQDSVKGK